MQKSLKIETKIVIEKILKKEIKKILKNRMIKMKINNLIIKIQILKESVILKITIKQI